MAKVLLVDDVELFLELEKSYLVDCGYELVTASSGEEVLSRIDELSPDIMLLDYYMPEMTGDEVCRSLKSSERWQHLPIIMVAASGKMEEIQQCLESGCDDYVTKPFDKPQLQEKISRLLGLLDKPATERFRLSIPVVFEVAGEEHTATTFDISLTGAYLLSSKQPAEGTAVNLQLALPTGTTLKLMGKVKGRNPAAGEGFGVYFIHPGEADVAALQEVFAASSGAAGKAPAQETGSTAPRLQELEQECARLREENQAAQQRIAELEKENLEFADQFVQVEEVNNNLTNLYIASSRLHSTLDREEALAIIKEVVINFVGAEKFAILVYDDNEDVLRYETGEGFDEDEPFPEVKLGEGTLGQTAEKKEDYFTEGSISSGSSDPADPLVAIPLVIHDEVIGLLAIYRLFVQKDQLDPIDFQLFSMLGEHAATALFSSALYSKSERKRQTYQGFMDLLLK